MTEFYDKTGSSNVHETERIAVVGKVSVIEELLANPQAFGSEDIVEQSRERAVCLPAIQKVTETLMSRPDKSLAGALRDGQLTHEDASVLYRSLTILLSRPDYTRLSLYVPFDFLTNPDESNPELTKDYDLFSKSYMIAWWGLLGNRDHRADFIDGDLPDDREATIPMVVKAAHLLPEMLRRGFVPIDDVEWLKEQARNDTVLLQSIDEALNPKSRELDTLDQIRQLELNDFIRPGAATLAYERELAKILELEGDIVEARVQWLQRTVRENIVYAISHQVLRDHPALDIALNFSTSDALDRQVAIAMFEKLAYHPDHQQVALEMLEAAIAFGDTAEEEQAALVLGRLCRGGMISRDHLESLGLSQPLIVGDVSRNILGNERIVTELSQKLERLPNSSLLGQFVYPTVLVGGSSLKGYGSSISDVDIAMCIRPGTPREIRGELREELARTFDTDVVELWLEQQPDGSLHVQDFDEFDPHEADSYWTHTLLQWAWLGDEQTIDDLQERLLPAYFQQDDELTRYLYLRRIEQDVLQYRLLQKGYARCFPTDINSHSATLPDHQSAFWDPGFRLLATRLYAEKVFLPRK